MSDTIKTILRTYSFDVTTESGRADWQALKEKLSSGPHCHGPVLADCWQFVSDLDGQTVELETRHLFDNQWNTAPIEGKSDKGLRVFDWALQADSAPHSNLSAPRGIRRGHYLEQTAEMRELRRNTMKCGYCGKQEPAAKGYVFCPHCIDSEYLKESDLPLTRMRPIDESGFGPKAKESAPLTEAEKAHLLPIYRAAQIHGSTERGKARIAAERAKVAAEYESTLHNATVKRDGFVWLMDRGIRTENVIFYSHTGRFSFGWRKPLGESELAELLAAMNGEFPFPYDIKTESGRTLSGE